MRVEVGSPAMLRPGDTLPHFEVMTLDAGRVRYRDLWQRRALVILALRRTDTASPAVSRLMACRAEVEAADAALVVTTSPVAGMDAPAVLIADRYGMVQYVAAAPAGESLSWPDADDLFQWLRYLQSICPECEGETR
jgi:hypothetical protein